VSRISDGEITIQYYFPVLGEVKIELKGYPAKFYKFLGENGEIERLMKLKHLGILSYLFPGIEHTRYEYTLLNLYLTHKLNLSDHADKEIGNLSVSKREFLDLLILSANIGHIYGTFAVEKATLFYLWENNALVQLLSLLGNLNCEEIKNKMETWLKGRQDYRLFNKVLALMKLSLWIEGTENENIKDMLQSISLIITNLLLKDERREYTENLCKRYNFVRKISYLFLDSAYIQSPLKISFLELFTNLQSNLENVINDIEALKLVCQYEQIVYDRLYHHDNARVLVGLIGKKIHEILRSSGKGKALEIILSWIQKSEIKEISTEVETIIRNIENYSNICCISLGSFSASWIIKEILENGIASSEKEIKQRIKNRHVIPSILLSDEILEGISGKIWIDIFASSGVNRNDYIGILTRAFDYIDSLDFYFGKTEIYERLFQYILKYAIERQKISVQLKMHPHEFFGKNVTPEKIIAFRNLKTGKDDVKEKIKEYFSAKEKPEWSEFQEDKFHEHVALWELIKLLRRRLYKGKTRLKNRLFLIFPCSIILTDRENNKNLVEFDGAVLEMKIKSGKAVLYLLEAKRRGKKDPIRELREKFRKLGITPYKIEKLRKKDGWAIWQLN